MGYYDAIENAWFKQREDGKYIFYPYGSFGRGYVLTEEEADKIKGFLGAFQALVIFIAIAGIIKIQLLPLTIIIYFLIYEIWMRRFLKNNERTSDKMTSAEAMKNMTSRMPLWMLIVFVLSEIVCSGFCIFMIIVVFETFKEKLFASLFLGFLIYCFWVSFKMISYKIKIKRKVKDQSTYLS